VFTNQVRKYLRGYLETFRFYLVKHVFVNWSRRFSLKCALMVLYLLYLLVGDISYLLSSGAFLNSTIQKVQMTLR